MMFYTLVLQFYLKIEQWKKDNDNYFRKENRRTTKLCYHTDICRWIRNSFSNEVEMTKGIVWINIWKKENFEKRSYEFNLGKSPD